MTVLDQLPPGAFDDRSSISIGTVVLCLAVATVAVGLRIWTRSRLIKVLGVDDCFAIFSLAVNYGLGIAICTMTRHGLGKHIYVLNVPIVLPLYLRDFYVTIVLYCAALFAVKMTFLFQYYRVLVVQSYRRVMLVAIFIVGGWSLSQVFVGIFLCNPVHAFWTIDGSLPDAKCIPNFPQFYINAGGNIITDVAVLLLPIPILLKLQLRTPQKVFLIGLFSLGLFTVIISAIRIKYLPNDADATWANVDAAAWSIGEVSSGIVCSCLPTLRPFAQRYLSRLGSGLHAEPGFYAHGDQSLARRGKAVDLESSMASSGRGVGGNLGLGRRHDGASESQTYVMDERRGAGGRSETFLETESASDTPSEDRGGMPREGARLGLHTTVRCKVESPGGGPLASGGAIHVQRDVHQIKRALRASRS